MWFKIAIETSNGTIRSQRPWIKSTGALMPASAWLGLVPQQHSSGGKERLGHISKRGDGYIRRLLVHGARAHLSWSRRKKQIRSAWLTRLLARPPTHVGLLAMANKTARIAWAMLSRGERYQERIAAAA